VKRAGGPPHGTCRKETHTTDRQAPILGTTTPGLEHYCPILAAHLDVMWPGHPPLYYALPAGRTVPYDRAIPTRETTWTGVLLGGLSFLRTLGATHVFVLLEDHVPLWPCDAGLVEEICRIAVRDGLACVFFNKYEWEWRSAEPGVDPAGRIVGRPRIDVVSVGGHRLARMPRDSVYYNQCQPAIWDLDYLASLLAEAARRGVGDPWAFERFSRPDQPPHYVSEYRWPSRHCGYRRRGRVYLRALYTMKLPEGRALRDELLRERFPGASPSLRRAFGEGFRLWGRVRRMPERFERPP
jgi:hypothetical protein